MVSHLFSLEIMIRQEKRNKQLFTFLDEFRTFDWDEFEEDFGDDDDAVNDKLVATVLEWIDTQWAASVKALRVISKDDFATLSQLAADNGGLAFMRDTYVLRLMRLYHPLTRWQHITPACQAKGCVDST